jgi:hypothetical protein
MAKGVTTQLRIGKRVVAQLRERRRERGKRGKRGRRKRERKKRGRKKRERKKRERKEGKRGGKGGLKEKTVEIVTEEIIEKTRERVIKKAKWYYLPASPNIPCYP